MEGTTSNTDDDSDYDYLGECPGIFIPCEDVEALQGLIYALYDNGVLNDETAFILKNAPDNMLEILNNPDFFSEVEILGIVVKGGDLKLLEVNTNDLL